MSWVFYLGKIKTYQIATNTLVVLSVIVGYFALEQGLRPEYLFYIYILFSLLVTIARPFIIKRISTFKIRSLIIESYIPAISVTVICCPLLFLKVYLSPWVLIFISYLYIAISIYYIALKSNERKYIQAQTFADTAIEFAIEACEIANVKYKIGTRKYKRS